MTIALAPVVLIGRNADIAFTTTSEETVDQQVYQETVDFSHDPPTYRFDGADVPMQAVPHTLEIPGQLPQTFVSYRTVHGPVIATDPAHGIAYSMKFASFGQEWKSFAGFAEQSTAGRISTSTAPRCDRSPPCTTSFTPTARATSRTSAPVSSPS